MGSVWRSSADFEETAIGTNPFDADSDDDGMLDGTEVDVAQGTGCPNPLNPDSDGDTLLDGTELTLGINPCLADSDDDPFPDPIDPAPTTPAATTGALEDVARSLAAYLRGLSLSLVNGPNDNARDGRRNTLASHADEAANAIARSNHAEASAHLALLEARTGGAPQPDWIVESPERDLIRSTVQSLAAAITP